MDCIFWLHYSFFLSMELKPIFATGYWEKKTDIGTMVRVFTSGPVESYQRLKKPYLMLPCLKLRIIR